MGRREEFREHISRLAANAAPSDALARKLYIHPPRATSDRLVSRLELEPTSMHLVVGAIGAGKTTQLLVARDRLNAVPDVTAAYVDVSEKQDLGKLKPGALVAIAALEIIDRLGVENIGLRRWANGFWADPDDLFEIQNEQLTERDYHFLPGKITAPGKEWPDIEDGWVTRTAEYCQRLHASGKTLVLLLDSLDRMTDVPVFVSVVEQDVAALRSIGVGLVLIGPAKSVTGFGLLDVQRFDQLLHQPAYDTSHDSQGIVFLHDALRRRLDENILAEDAAGELIRFSGGLLRDLIALAKGALDEAYVSGAPAIGVEHVARAADTLGRSLMVGLSPPQVSTLRALLSTGRFVQVSADDVALVATRRILVYDTPVNAFAVHPTIAPLLGPEKAP